LPCPPTPPLFPYTTLFRSAAADGLAQHPQRQGWCWTGRAMRIGRVTRESCHAHLAVVGVVVGLEVLVADGPVVGNAVQRSDAEIDRKSTRLNSSHVSISYA